MNKKPLTILLIIFFLITASISFLFSPFFKVREFSIHSRQEIDKKALQRALLELYDYNILLLDKDIIKSKLERFSFISSIEIKKTLPSKVHIIIDERTPIAWIDNKKSRIIFSADGIILNEVTDDRIIDLPELAGVAYKFDNNKLKFPDYTDVLFSALLKIDQNLLHKINKILYTDDGIYKLYLDTNTGVNLGTKENIEKKFNILASILQKIESENKKADYIDLKVVKHPVIKLKSE
ncbi:MULTISPECIES: cell division protein FtsQ/DivIB [unclassified Halanaerobium]|uniref:cell division protein FtsQ/DivIB n=1 Tax=unclassified Halanaerobium TaxID=2641197 RepID=UPI000E1B1300|nr:MULTISPECIES: FtsQ-type POTRA domain-containing protein [unclassified Halanaerobium]RCW51384.1 cell division protein FtsQ [Halanaerobium sp. MA284_MarDTE_T2]RCW81417.1 cell division protein FtsQ [Halanaerobium sp. DL-01]